MNQLMRNLVKYNATGILQASARSFCAAVYDSKGIEGLVKENKVVVFMKGTPAEPRCGFSNAVVRLFEMHNVKYSSHDVLQNESLRQGIKDFSNWPTIPQVFINGEFVGGCDILLQMHQNGELIQELKKAGITSALES